MQFEKPFKALLCCGDSDLPRVREFRDQLNQIGICARIVGEDFGGAECGLSLEREMRTSNVALVFLSKSSVASTGHLQRSIFVATEVTKEKPPGHVFLTPVRLDDCETHIRLARLHRVDVFDSYGWARLFRQIEQMAREYRAALRETTGEATQPDAKVVGPSLPSTTPSVLPIISFSREVADFLRRCLPQRHFAGLSAQALSSVLRLGAKFEPILQIVPRTPSPLVLGFESLALGARGENFGQLEKTCAMDSGLFRLALAVTAIESISYMRLSALKQGNEGAVDLLYSVNLDPTMIEHPHFETFLTTYRLHLGHNVFFEISEETTERSLQKLKELQVDFNLRYVADDLSRWDDAVRAALMPRVEMTKLDCAAFRRAMTTRGNDPHETVFLLGEQKLQDKALIVEGIRDTDFRFLREYWDFARHGFLYGQGQSLKCGAPWDAMLCPLQAYGHAGGLFLRKPVPEEVEIEVDVPVGPTHRCRTSGCGSAGVTGSRTRLRGETDESTVLCR